MPGHIDRGGTRKARRARAAPPHPPGHRELRKSALRRRSVAPESARGGNPRSELGAAVVPNRRSKPQVVPNRGVQGDEIAERHGTD